MERYCSGNGNFFPTVRRPLGEVPWGRGPRGREDIDRGCPEPRQVARRAMRHARGGGTARGRVGRGDKGYGGHRPGVPPNPVKWHDGRCGTGAGGAHGEGRGMPSRAPRRGAAARWGHRALPQRGTGGAHDHGARLRDGDIAPYRNGARVVRTATAHGWG